MKKEWIIATRPWSLVASIGPILIGTSLSWNIITISIKHFLLTLWGGIFLQISANLINSYYDYKMGLDQKETSEDRTLFDGKHLSPNQVKIFGIVCFLISFFIGFYFVFFFQKIELFYLFFIGGFFAIFYTAQPLKLKYYALGDICIFLCFGPLIIEGTYFIQTGEFSKSILYFSIPSGLLADAILHVNNTRDIQVDLKGGAKTLPQFLGKTISLFFFYFFNFYLLFIYNCFIFNIS
jgi:1,4-dihydroxy-2-naphthoate octaprenyltransferase